MSQTASERNNEFLNRIDQCARESLADWFPDTAERSLDGRRGPVEIDYWSISYRLDFVGRAVFVKIPKMDMRETEIAAILDDPRARQSAQTEFESFFRIHSIQNWPKGCSTVRPLKYVQEFNALLTEFTPAEDLFRQCRRPAAQLIRLSAPSQQTHAALRRCGEWLKHFQDSDGCSTQIGVSSQQLLEDIVECADAIDSRCFFPRQLRALLGLLKQNPWSRQMPRRRTCEGFEVRNVIVDGDGTVRIVDPGNLSCSSGLEDVAHFCASLGMLYWGGPLLWAGIPLATSYQRSFLRGWANGDAEIEPSILAWFETCEWFRQWLEAYRVLARKPYPRLLREFMRFAYVDAFFLNRIEHSVRLACR